MGLAFRVVSPGDLEVLRRWLLAALQDAEPQPEAGIPTARQQSTESSKACELFGSPQRQEVLSAFDRILQASEQLLKVGAALDEVDVGGVDDEQVRSRVAEEEVLVSAGDFFDVFDGNLVFITDRFFGNASAQDFRLGLKIDDQIGRRDFSGQRFVVAIVEFELGVVEVEIGVDAILFQQEIGKDGTRSFYRQGFAKAALAFDQKIHLGAEGGARF